VEDRKYLSWPHRFPLILQDLRALLGLGLIVCAEEVDHIEDYEQALQEEAICIWAKKRVDGTAMFIPKDRYRVLEYEGVPLVEGNAQIGLFCRLESLKAPSQTYLLVATHLKAKVGFEDLRQRQATALCKEIAARRDAKDAVFVCGDFNDIPSSLAVATMQKNHFKSAYQSLNLETYTTSKIRESLCTRCIDYIFFEDGFDCTDCLSIPPSESLGARALPKGDYPSDHLSIAAIFSKKK
jgi:endonuclease/exonuclease/phosphatase family metal-dependent hydrolase